MGGGVTRGQAFAEDVEFMISTGETAERIAARLGLIAMRAINDHNKNKHKGAT